MNTGQIMFVLGAFAMLSVMSLSFNRTMFGSTQLGYEMEATLNALSVGQSMLDEIMQRDFDQNTTNGKVVYSFDSLTANANLGRDGGIELNPGNPDVETPLGSTVYASKACFNDVDDYHLYHRKVWDAQMGWFDVLDSVKYVSETSPNTETTSPTFYKKIVVVVTHPSLPKMNPSDTASLPIILRDIKIYRQFF